MKSHARLPLRLVLGLLLGTVSLHAQFQGLGGLTAADPYSEAYGISGDGSTVIGVSVDENGDLRSFRWTAAEGMVALPVINPEWYGSGYGYSEAHAVSHDGSVIVGEDYNLGSVDGGTIQAFRWTAGATPSDPGTIAGLPYVDPDYSNSVANAVSADGSVVVGREGGSMRAFRWTAATGTVLISGDYGEASGVSADGNIVVGTSENGAFRWTAAGGLDNFLSASGFDWTEATAISADGSTIVGHYDYDRSYAWTANGIQLLADIPGEYSTETHVLAVSADGRWAVGHSGQSYAEVATLWDTTTGEVSDLNQLFTTSFNFNLEGWQLNVATGISADGLTITGWGLNPEGSIEGWVAHMGAVPEPAATAALAGLGALALAAFRRRRTK